MAGIAYWILVRCIITTEGKDSLVAKAVGKDVKGIISIVVYTLAIPLAFINVWLAQIGYIAVALMWLIRDRRIEKALSENSH